MKNEKIGRTEQLLRAFDYDGADRLDRKSDISTHERIDDDFPHRIQPSGATLSHQAKQ